MLMLSSEPYWLDLMKGVRVQVRPVTTEAFMKARDDCQAAVRIAMEGVEPGADDKIEIPAEVQRLGRVTLIGSLAESGIVAWEGVGGPDGKAVEPDPVNIARLVAHYAAYEALERLYAGPVLEAEAEKNASAPSQGGASTPRAATPTATAATPANPDSAAAGSAPPN